MSTDVFEDYLNRMEYEYEVDEENSAIDISAETADGYAFTVTLVTTRTAYSLFVCPLVELGKRFEKRALYQRLLEISDRVRHVKLSVDADGDVKLAAEGFSRLDAYGQFRRRLEAVVATVEDYGQEIAELAGGELA